MRVSSWRRLVLYGLLSVNLAVCGQFDPDQTLRAIRSKITQGVMRLPNFLCTQTVDRQTSESNSLLRAAKSGDCDAILATADKHSAEKLQVVSSDRLRLDVALSQRAEMYSWVGEGRFDDRDLSQIVKEGATSTGAFGSFLHAIFATNNATFTFKGESIENGRALLTYGYVVPQSRSGYQVSTQTISRITGYSGIFVVDARSLDLLKLDINPDSLDPELKICRSSTTLDYSKLRLSNADVLLPSEVNLTTLSAQGVESHNRTVFTGCHQFLGESKLIFDDQPAEDKMISAAPAKDVKLAPGLKVSVMLTQNVDPATAAAGDPVAGKLTKAIKDPSGGLTIPKGSKVNGRLFGVVNTFTNVQSLQLAIKWESVETGGIAYPLDLLLKSALSSTARNTPPARRQWPDVDVASNPSQPGIGFFFIPDVAKNYKVPVGFEAEWVTVAPPTPESK